jgi:asparaginyl-tRNA synthetase
MSFDLLFCKKVVQLSYKNMILSKDILDQINNCDVAFNGIKADFKMPQYNGETHYLDLTRSKYYQALVFLRHYIKFASDYYFGVKQGAQNMDLFIFTPSVSSPMGPGSNSKPVLIRLGRCKIFLVDSSQFGFEPLLLNGFKKVYCYLPSMRGENCDSRHLSQFYHCEMEMVGTLDELIPIVEGYVKVLAEVVLSMSRIVEKISEDPQKTKKYLNKVIASSEFPRITFDEAVDILVKNGKKDLVNFTRHGNDISAAGEVELLKIIKAETPVWLTHFDRDRVPFYQKPDPENKNKTINADLLFPSIVEGAFGGEVLGSGQRQDNADEMYESLKRQNNISPESYEWYIDLRNQPNYKVTSGFGLGIERFLAWSLGKSNIRDVILYPRLKNTKTWP